jgi:hypothetical protein
MVRKKCTSVTSSKVSSDFEQEKEKKKRVEILGVQQIFH